MGQGQVCFKLRPTLVQSHVGLKTSLSKNVFVPNVMT